jgi:hypothetical protein
MVKKRTKKFAVTTSSPGASEASLIAAEKQFNLSIPSDFRDFLAANDGGSPSKTDVVFGEGHYQDARIRYFFSTSGPPRQRLAYAIDEYNTRIPPGFFPIACDESDNLFVMANDRKVYYWDHEYENEGILEPLRLVADSFHEFLGKLHNPSKLRLSIVVLEFADGTSVRRVLPQKTFSKTRNEVVPVEELHPGEVIEEFGVAKTLRNTTIVIEEH